MVKKYGVIELARKIARREPYRKYVSRWPFDHTQTRLSMEVLSESGYDPPTEENIEKEYVSEETVAAFLASLTTKQRVIVDKLMLGYSPKDLYQNYGHKSTGAIRYHKFVLRKLWKDFINDKPINSD